MLGGRDWSILNRDTRKEGVVKATLLPLYPTLPHFTPLVWNAGWVSESLCTGVESIKSRAPTGFRTQNHAARVEYLYQLNYPVR